MFKASLWQFGGWTPRRSSEVYNSKNCIEWNFIGNALWFGRYVSGSVVFIGNIFIIGGYDNSGVLNDVWSGVDSRIWNSEVRSAPFGKRGAFGLVEFNKRLFLTGGIGAIIAVLYRSGGIVFH